MLNTFKSFDASSATLHRGVNVVEASAGTGKTYAIAMLVLRFVVEHNVPVDELLVVSYTKAATEELRSRIRTRLLDARDLLTGSIETFDDKAFLKYLRSLPDAVLALKRLELALLDMDRAAVFTIHGFCQRMLQEQALESGQFFDMELTADVAQIQDELVFDYWRRNLYDLPPFHCSLFINHFSSPDALYATVKNVAVEDRIEPSERIPFEEALGAVDESFELLVLWWQKNSSKLEKSFLDALEKGMFKKPFAEKFDSLWHQCTLFFSGSSQYFPKDFSWLGKQGLMEFLNGSKLRGDAKKDAFLQNFNLAGEILDEFLLSCERAVLSFRIQLALELQTGLRQRLLEQGRFSFDDLVLSLAAALQGPQQKELKQVLASRFQVALIDEFQDTDAAQYRIFSTLFGGEEKKHFLFLIGDPKQAIYKFRGADIYAYFKARKSADFLLGLEKNYRSNPQLVQAVNTLFLQKTDAFVRCDLPYVRVTAAKSAEYLQFWQDEKAGAAMVYCSLESPHEEGVKPWTSGKCRERIQSYVVSEIQELLEKSFLQTDAGEKKRVLAGDIAILVRTNKQAEEFQLALAHASIPSVMSSRKTVFETRECADLLQVIQAVALPSDIRLLRTAISCNWFAMNGQTFYAKTRNDLVMDAWMERFYDYHRLWQEKGFLAMMNSLFSKESVFETLCTLPLAERSITNLMHLTEIVQEAEVKGNLSSTHVLQYLSSQMESGKAEGEYAELRLESDEDAVKVVTMHAVKGLEYPIVFCPYLWHRSGWLQKEKNCITYHDEENNQVADLGSTDFERRREVALQEELAEEVRLLYVAVTRASSRCYVFWADVGGRGAVAPSKKSALAWVLSLDECGGISEQTERIAALCGEDSVELREVTPLQDEQALMVAKSLEDIPLSCKTFSRSLPSGEWLMTSYSALAGAGYAVPHVTSLEAMVQQNNFGKIHDLPFGAAFGNVVHGLLEDFPFSMLAGTDDYEEECLAQCRRFGVVAQSDQLMSLVRDVTRSPLGHGGVDIFALTDLEEKDVLKEMPFYFHLREKSTEQINSLLDFSSVVQPIQERQLKGYLTGFIDLVCRHQGKYYIMDYKTNYLGESIGDYAEENLVLAMHDHNYGLQYWIYTMVLHRFLKATIPGYEYERDFGGVFYLFARGMSPKYPANGVYYNYPEKSVLDGLYGCLGAEHG